jgi:hypothetical protein
MDGILIDHALALILDDPRIGEFAAGETNKRLKRLGPNQDQDDDDDEWWATYTAITNELIDAARARNARSPD